MKWCLNETIRQAKPSYDELLTTLVEVEMVLNLRPLTYMYMYVSSDDMDEPLPPSHFLVARVYNRERGEYPTSLWACVITLYGGCDLCNNIHRLEVSVLAVCGHVHVAKPHVLYM